MNIQYKKFFYNEVISKITEIICTSNIKYKTLLDK